MSPNFIPTLVAAAVTSAVPPTIKTLCAGGKPPVAFTFADAVAPAAAPAPRFCATVSVTNLTAGTTVLCTKSFFFLFCLCNIHYCHRRFLVLH